MKAIETRYKNCRFRSRTEAKWAVFFEHLGAKWEYELQGYELSDGSWYLPDFLVQFINDDNYPDPMWFEVKGAFDEISEPEWNKMVLFGAEQPLILLDGQPDSRHYGMPYDCVLAWDEVQDKFDSDFVERTFEGFRENFMSANPNAVAINADYRARVGSGVDEGYMGPRGLYTGPRGLDANPYKYDEAVYFARSARFEHGESGRT